MHNDARHHFRGPLALFTVALLFFVVVGTAHSRGGARRKAKPTRTLTLKQELAQDAAEGDAILRAVMQATARERTALRSHLVKQGWYTKLNSDLKKAGRSLKGRRSRLGSLRRARPSLEAAYRSKAAGMEAKALVAGRKHVRSGSFRATRTGGFRVSVPPSIGGGSSGGSTSTTEKRLGSWTTLPDFVNQGWKLANNFDGGRAGSFSNKEWDEGAGPKKWSLYVRSTTLLAPVKKQLWASGWGIRNVTIPAGYGQMRIRASAEFRRVLEVDVAANNGGLYATARAKMQLRVTKGSNTWVATIDNEFLGQYEEGWEEFNLGTDASPTQRNIELTLDVDAAGGTYEIRFGGRAESKHNEFLPFSPAHGDAGFGLDVRNITIDLLP